MDCVLDRKPHFWHADISDWEGWELFSHLIDWHFHLCSLLSLQQAVSGRDSHLETLCKNKRPSHAISGILLWVCDGVCPFCSSASFGVVVRDAPFFFFFFSFLSCSHSLPHNGFGVMIVVFCSALTHNAVSQWELMCAELWWSCCRGKGRSRFWHWRAKCTLSICRTPKGSSRKHEIKARGADGLTVCSVCPLIKLWICFS